MKRTYYWTGLLLALFAAPASAQVPVVPAPSVSVAWDAVTAVNEGVTRFDLYADGTRTISNIPATARSVPFPALTPGVHVLEITATNPVGESARSAALNVLVIVTVPSAPTSLRIITARWDVNTGWVPVLEIL